MIKIKRITLKNYMSYKDATIELPENGLIFIKGINKDNGENSAIEAGKTNLLESILFCLFGKTTRNLAKADYVHWGESDLFIELEFYNGCIVRRTLDKVEFITPDGKQYNSDKKTTIQAQINNYFGFDFKSFFHTVYMGYMYKSFVDLTPSERLKTFTTLFGLDILDKCSSYSKKKSNELNTLLTKYEIDVANLSGQLKQLSNSYQDKILEWEKQKEQKINQLLQEKKKLKDKIDTAYKLATDKSAKIEEIKKQYRLDIDYGELKQKANDLQGIIKRLESEKVEIEKELALLKKDLNILDKRLALFKDGKCPTCERPFKGDEKILVDLNNKKNQIQEQINNKIARMDDVELQLSILHDKYNKINTDLDRYLQYERFVQKLETEVFRYKTYVEEWSKELKTLKKKLLELNTMQNPYKGLENERLEKLNKCKVSLQKKLVKRDEIKDNFNAYSFWIDKFKKIKLKMFSNLQKAYERQFNSYLSLFGSQATIKIVNENDKLDIEFYYQGHKCRLDNFSAGGTQMLRLPASFALADLLKYKVTGHVPAVLVLDEPFVNLSIKERQNFMNYLYSIKNERQIFLIEHAVDVQQESFDKILTVVKENGISFIRSE